MNRKIILAVAPVGDWGSGNGNPLSPEEVAAEVEASTGGFSGLTAAERVLPVSDPRARLCSNS